MTQPLRILFVEDLPTDQELAARQLSACGMDFISQRVETQDGFLQALDDFQPDLIISDYTMPEFNGMQALELTLELKRDIPFIVLTGSMNEETAADCIKAGATDYVIKEHIHRLAFAVQNALKKQQIRKQKERAEKLQRETEARYRAVVYTATDAIVSLDSAGCIVDWNPGAERVFGYPEIEIRGQSITFLIPVRYHNSHLVNIFRVKAGEENYIVGKAVEMIGLCKGGIEFPLELSLSEWQIADEKFYTAIIRDITERKRAEEKLAASEAELRALFAGMTDVVIIYDADGRYIKIAPTNPANLYRPLDNMLGKTVHDILQKENADYIVAKIRSALQSGEIVDGEYSQQISGKEIWFASSASRLPDNTVVWVAHDITNRKLAEEEVRHRLSELEVLYASSIAISQLLRPKEIGQKIIDILSERLQWHHVTIRQYHSESQTLELLAFNQPGLENEAERLAAEERFNKMVTRPEQGLASWVIKHGQLVYCGDVTKDERYVEIWPTIRSGMYVPLKIGERTIGCLSVESERGNAFTETDEWLITTLATQAASALENARLFEETRQRLAELEAVTKISIALRTAESLDNMLPAFLDETLILLGMQAGAIWLYNPASQELRQAASRGWFNQLPKTAVKPGEGLAGTAFATGKTLHSSEFIRDASALDAGIGQIPAGWGGVCIPIRSAQAVVGVMLIFVQLPRELTTADMRILNTLSEIVGIAIQRMRLHEQTRQQLQRARALHEIDTVIAASFDMSITLDIFLKNVLAQLHVDAASIFLMHVHSRTLDFTAGKGFRIPGIEQLHLSLNEGYAGRVAFKKCIIHYADLLAENISSAYTQLIKNEGFVSYYGVPLIVKGEVIGVLEIFNRTPLKTDAEWLVFLEAMAAQAAIAIDSNLTYNDLQRSNLELVVTYDVTLRGWSRALDMRDKETEGHSERVAEMALQLARVLGVGGVEAEHIRRGALLHDLGKIGIPDSILLKPGPLTDEEWEVMRTHPDRAYEMLASIPYLLPALEIPYCHHEKWDGSGYPRGLIGEQIPLAARIFAVVDVYDALMSDRPYRPAWSKEKTLQYMLEQSGKHFDPQVVDAFLKLILAKTGIIPE